MVGNSKASPLPSDPQRQADRTIRAYVYQIWQSVYAWTVLKDDETLYLEGAEDFDVVGPEVAVATQVKDSGRRVTLRSVEIQEALGNAWALFSKAPQRNVQYRFLTRGEAGVESGNPFGKGVAGLKLWRDVNNSSANVRPLARFLCKLTTIDPRLREFLRTASDEVITRTFFARINWDTASPEDEYVERAVEHQLALFGEKLHVGYSEATAAKDRLFSVVCEIAKNSTRRELTRVDFLREFEQATRVSMSHAEASGLREANRLLGPLLRGIQPATGGMMSFSEVQLLDTEVPPLPSTIVERLVLVRQLSTTLLQFGSLVLYGSTGMGKTTLAKLVITTFGGSWLWIRFSGRSVADARRLIIECTRRVSASATPVSIVFDDVDFSPSSVCGMEAEIGGLLYLLRDRRGMMILTSQKLPPHRLLAGSRIDPASVQSVPSFGIDEIALMFGKMGCPPENGVSRWAQLCRLVTHGHPQLVQAYVIGLRERQWPIAKGDDLFQPMEMVAEEKIQSRQLVDSLPEVVRELLFRLTVIGGPFRREHALVLGEASPELPRPGEVFDRLDGPWIEPIGADSYRVSPLLDKAGEAIYSPKRLRELRISIIEALRACEPISAAEAGIAFHQAWQARSIEHLVSLVGSFITAPRRVKEHIARHIEWFTVEGLTTGAVLFPENRFLSRMLRSLQFELAPNVFPDLSPKILDAWHREVNDLEANASPEEKLLLAYHALAQIHVPISISRMFEYIRDIDAVERSSCPIGETIANIIGSLPQRITAGSDSMAGMFARFIIPRCRTVEMLEELLNALAVEKVEFRDRVLAAWTGGLFNMRALIDGVWLNFTKRENPNWKNCLTVLRRAFEFGGAWSAPELSVAATRGSTIVLNEALHRPEEALALLESNATSQRLESAILDDARATVHFSQNRDELALACWVRALMAWPHTDDRDDRSDSFAARMAGRAAGKLGRWYEAAGHFVDAHRRLKTKRGPEYTAGLLADAGFAFWRAGDKRRALDNLIASMRSIESLPRGKDNLLAFRLHKIVGGMILWLHNVETARDTYELNEPQPGMCSELEAHPGFRDLPENDHDIAWLFLARLECTLGFDSGLHEEVIKKMRASSSETVALCITEYEIERLLQRRQIAALPRLALEFYRTMVAASKVHPGVPSNLDATVSFHVDDRASGAGLLVAGLVIHGGKDEAFSECFASWRSCAMELHAGEELINWLGYAEGLLTAEVEIVAPLLNDEHANWADVLVAALNVASASIATLQDLAMAHFRLLYLLADTPWLLSCGESLFRLFTGGWLRAALNSSDLGFPNLSVPAVRAKSDNSAYWVSKAAEVVVAGARVAGMRITPAFHPRLKAMLSGELQNIRRKEARL